MVTAKYNLFIISGNLKINRLTANYNDNKNCISSEDIRYVERVVWVKLLLHIFQNISWLTI